MRFMYGLPRPGVPFPESVASAGCVTRRGYPLLEGVAAGQPLPSARFAEEFLSLEDSLAPNREGTFLVRVSGSSMTGFGIHDGDVLVVDRTLEAADQRVVVAVVDGAFVVKQLVYGPHGVLLRSGAPALPDIWLTADQHLSIWGVVTASVHHLV